MHPETSTQTPISNSSNSISDTTPKVSALSISSIKAKKELELQQRLAENSSLENRPTQSFTSEDFFSNWNYFTNYSSQKGFKLMASYMQMGNPRLEGTKISIDLPNESSKNDFMTNSLDLLKFLRKKLNNHDISIEVIVKETTRTKIAFTPNDKYERLKEINPDIELLRQLFELDF